MNDNLAGRNSSHRARVRATFMRRTSARKPIEEVALGETLARTHEKMTWSASLPCFTTNTPGNEKLCLPTAKNLPIKVTGHECDHLLASK